MKSYYTTIIENNLRIAFLCITLLLVLNSCSDFIEIPAPRTDLVKSTVFKEDATATATLLDIYQGMKLIGFASGAPTSCTFLTSLSSDETVNYTSGGLKEQTDEFYTNQLTPQNEAIGNSWAQLYNWIYKSNAILEGIHSPDARVSPALQIQLEGEAKFIRAFCYFYLVNLWGDVPLVLSTDYQINSQLSSSASQLVYEQIVRDLTDAQQLLSENYSFSNDLRTRPNKWTATALLARTYLYLQEWDNAIRESTKIIDNTALYSLEPIDNIFNKNSKEALWQLEPYSNYAWDILTYYIFYTPPPRAALRAEFANTFETDDQRSISWIGSITSNTGSVFLFPKKYSSFVPLTEYSTIFRLAELYLIRAEAQAQSGDVAGSQEDLNMLRSRANLPNTNADSKETLLEAVAKERKAELFCEWGHRWLDLKRTGQIDIVLGPLKPEWKPESALFPVPESQVLNSPVRQNPGY